MAAPTDTAPRRRPSLLAMIKGFSAFLMYRFPFLSAMALTMLCSEREGMKKPEGFPVVYIYIHIVVLFACGTLLSFGSQRPLWSIVTAVSMTIFTTVTQSQQPSTKMWLMARIASHDIGVIGVFLILASRAGESLLVQKKRYRLHFLYPYGKIFISIFCIINAVQLYRTPEERRAFLSTLPHQETVMIALGAAMLVGGFLLSSEFQTRRVSVFTAVALVFFLLTIDGNLHYWHHRARVEYWMQMNMVLNTATVVCALMFLAT